MLIEVQKPNVKEMGASIALVVIGWPKAVFAVLGGWSWWKKPVCHIIILYIYIFFSSFFLMESTMRQYSHQISYDIIRLSPSLNHFLGAINPTKAYKYYKSPKSLSLFSGPSQPLHGPCCPAAGRCWAPGCPCWSLRFCRQNSRQWLHWGKEHTLNYIYNIHVCMYYIHSII